MPIVLVVQLHLKLLLKIIFLGRCNIINNSKKTRQKYKKLKIHLLSASAYTYACLAAMTLTTGTMTVRVYTNCLEMLPEN